MLQRGSNNVNSFIFECCNVKLSTILYLITFEMNWLSRYDSSTYTNISSLICTSTYTSISSLICIFAYLVDAHMCNINNIIRVRHFSSISIFLYFVGLKKQVIQLGLMEIKFHCRQGYERKISK